MSPRSAAERWAAGLSEWTIPDHIFDAAPSEPFVFTPEMFAAPAPGTFELSGSNRRAAEAVPDGGVVLDVGCGGGAASFALVPPAGELIGVDRQADMLDLFEQTASDRGITASIYRGLWPDDADAVPQADVVVAHNVLYNVPTIVEFARALDAHARQRVVIEITDLHPQTVRAPLWEHFWGITRPNVPNSSIAFDAIREAGIDATVEETVATARDDARSKPVEAAFWCRMLCLPPERRDEVAELLDDIEFPRERVTIWWTPVDRTRGA